jgi:hypothetical protein
MSVALYVDLLGTRSAWKQGVDAVRDRLAAFESLIFSSLRQSRTHPTLGLLETDAIVLCFDDVERAVRFGVFLFRAAFREASREGHRTWLRGVIGPVAPGTRLRTSTRTAVATIRKYTYSIDLFGLVNAEKSGFKGMRLLLAEGAIDKTLETRLGVRVGRRGMSILTKLRYSVYPDALPFPCCDVQWCLSAVVQEEAALNNLMQRRLRWSTKVREEFEQAAATQVLFHESYAQLHAFRRKVGVRPPRNPYYAGEE